MKKRTITAVLSIVLTTTTLTGCSMPEKVLSLIGKSDAEASKEIPEDDIKENLTEVGEDEIQDVFEDGFIKVPVTEDTEDTKATEASKLPSFRVASKRYSIKYDGDATFNETDENVTDYSKGILFKGEYRYLLMDEACKDDYPFLYETLNSEAKESMSKTDGYANSMADEARELYEEAAEGEFSFFGPFSYESFVSVTRNDGVVLSVYDYSSDFEGGAHGMYGATGHNYDVITGEKLDISDVIDIDKEKLDEILKDKLLAMAAEKDTDYTYLDSALESTTFNPENDPENGVYEHGYKWYLSFEGLHVIFNPYEIGTFGDGMQDVLIGYDEFPGMINEKYIPESNVDHIFMDKIYFVQDKYDYDDDGLHFRYTPFEPDVYEDDMVAEKFELVKDGKSAVVDSGFYVNDENSFDIYRVLTRDGREFVYLFVPTESDYLDLYAFDVTDDVKFIGKQYYHELYENEGNDFMSTPILMDPYDMHLGYVGNSFGTYIYYGNYEVGKDGLPTLTSDVYHLEWKSNEAYSKVDIKADEVDIDGNTLESGVTIPKGEHFVPFRTDKESYMDFYLDDGRIIRLTYTNFEYPATIPEGNIDDLFEGIIYAG